MASPLTLAWSTDFGGAVSYAIVGGGTVFVAAGNPAPAIYAADLATGKALWNLLAGAPLWLAYDQGTLFGLDGSGNLTAWNVATQNQLWTVKLVPQYLFQSPPVATGGFVYVNGVGSGGTTYAVNEADGGIAWSKNTSDGSEGTVAVSGGVVYEAEEVEVVNAFDAATGKLVFSYDGMPGSSGGGGAAPAVYQGLVYARDTDGDYILNATGKLVGSFDAAALPAFNAGSAFYFNSGFSIASVVEAEDLAKTSLLWRFSGDPGLCTGAVVAGDGGQVFVGSNYGGVYELDEATGMVVSTADAGSPVTCSSETASLAIAGGHLLVPVGNSLFVY